MRKIFLLSLFLSTGTSQVDLDVFFTPYVTYYVTSVDLGSGATSIPIFTADIVPSDPPATIIIEFEITVTSSALALNEEILAKIVSDPFTLYNQIHLRNQDFTLDTREIRDVTGAKVDFSITIEEMIEGIDGGGFETGSPADNLFNNIIQAGSLPDGQYRFSVKVWDETYSTLIAFEDQTLDISHPTYLQLSSPGGILSDTTINEIYTNYPLFQWQADPCKVSGGCNYYIRVAEFIPDQHATLDEAIEGLTNLPLDQTQGFYSAGAGIQSFQYPTTDAGDLEEGKVYAWQVLKVMETTLGTQGVISEIMVFKIHDFSEPATGPSDEGGGPALSPAAQALQILIGEEQYNSIFSDGGLAVGYTPNGNISQDGTSVDISVIQSLSSQGVPNEPDSLGNVTYHEISILGVEVEE